jgi:glycine/D-amino acid oxidase-like deaminating enzyme
MSSERSVSLWGKNAAAADAKRLDADATADVAIVGAGLAGLSVAYELARTGRRVIVLDRGTIAGGMTARTTGHLASELDDYYHELIAVRGVEEARQVCAAQIAAIDRIETIVRGEHFDCDFRRLDGYLFLAPQTAISVLEKEFGAARELGLEVTWAERAPIPGAETSRCLRFPNQGRFHPLKYAEGLIRCIERDGGGLHAETTVNEVAPQEDGSVLVKTDDGATVRAGACVVATNSPINEFNIHFKQAPYRTYALAGRVPADSVEDALYWDTLDPYHYVRLQPAEDGAAWLIAGGEDHKAGEAKDMEERFARLEAWTRVLFPSLGTVEHRWSGQVLEPVDYAAFIGASPTGKNIYMATGDSGQGLTNAVAASLILRDLVAGRDSPYAKAHDPQRVSLGTAKQFVSENLTAVTNLAEHITGGDAASFDDIVPGEGGVVRQGLSMIAAYRDEGGGLHLRSAKCHGSHFASDGTAINGPAVEPLGEVAP